MVDMYCGISRKLTRGFGTDCSGQKGYIAFHVE
jgi:hypothetical protein